jgi:HEAT repeat protein
LVVCWALGEIKNPKTVDALADVLEQDEDALVREMAALALGELNAPNAVRPLTDAFDRDENLRAAIAWALGEIRCDEAQRAREAVLAKSDRSASGNTPVWAGALEAWDLFRDDVPRLLHELREGDANERRFAAWNLGFLGALSGLEEPLQIVEALLDALRDPSPEVRAMAAWSLDEINPSRFVRRGLDMADEDALHEYRLNSLGYYLLGAQRLDQAIEVFQINVQLHPDSWNCYDSLAEGYLYANDIPQALVNYEISLELNPKNEHGRRMLGSLLGSSNDQHSVNPN